MEKEREGWQISIMMLLKSIINHYKRCQTPSRQLIDFFVVVRQRQQQQRQNRQFRVAGVIKKYVAPTVTQCGVHRQEGQDRTGQR